MLSGSVPMSVPSLRLKQGAPARAALLLAAAPRAELGVRGRVLRVLGYQIVLLSLGLAGLGLTGLAIDILRHQLDPSNRLPDLLAGLGRLVDAEREPMRAVLSIGAAILAMAAARGDQLRLRSRWATSSTWRSSRISGRGCTTSSSG